MAADIYIMGLESYWYNKHAEKKVAVLLLLFFFWGGGLKFHFRFDFFLLSCSENGYLTTFADFFHLKSYCTLKSSTLTVI